MRKACGGCVAELEEFCFTGISLDNDEWFEQSAIGRKGLISVDR
jgi:hypothetical protein